MKNNNFKIAMLAIALSITALTTKAQEAFKKSDKIVEGSVAWSIGNNDCDYSADLSLGHFVTGRFAVGITGGIAKSTMDSTSNTNVGVFGRCHFLNVGDHLKVYSQLGANYETKVKDFSAVLGIGANYFVSSKLALTVHLTDLASYSSASNTMAVGLGNIDNPFRTAKFGLLYKF